MGLDPSSCAQTATVEASKLFFFEKKNQKTFALEE
jgi:hypothetical protein